MKHHWWWTELLVNLLEKAIKRDPLIDGWTSSFDDWRTAVERGKILERFMKEEPGNFHALIEIAGGDACVVGGAIPFPLQSDGLQGGKSVCLTISLKQGQQAEAERAYGGVFPEHVRCVVFASGTETICSYVWMGKVDDTAVYIFVEFRGEVVYGEGADEHAILVRA